jgi:hypothetical protein
MRYVQNSGDLCYYYGAGMPCWLGLHSTACTGLTLETATHLILSSASLQSAFLGAEWLALGRGQGVSLARGALVSTESTLTIATATPKSAVLFTARRAQPAATPPGAVHGCLDSKMMFLYDSFTPCHALW